MKTMTPSQAAELGWDKIPDDPSQDTPRDAMIRYARCNGLQITDWTKDGWPYAFAFEEDPRWIIWRTSDGCFMSAYVHNGPGAEHCTQHLKHASFRSAIRRVRDEIQAMLTTPDARARAEASRRERETQRAKSAPCMILMEGGKS